MPIAAGVAMQTIAQKSAQRAYQKNPMAAMMQQSQMSGMGGMGYPGMGMGYPGMGMGGYPGMGMGGYPGMGMGGYPGMGMGGYPGMMPGMGMPGMGMPGMGGLPMLPGMSTGNPQTLLNGLNSLLGR